MTVKQIANNPKLWQLLTTVLTAVLGYYGYEQVQQAQPADVDVEVIVPEQTTVPEHSHGLIKHSHPQHEHRDWTPVIKSEIDKVIREYH